MKLLLDEHVSPAVADGLHHSDAEVLRAWFGGRYPEASDEAVVSAAADDDRVLVTYDQRTIRPHLKLWAEVQRSHAGVVFIDHRTILPNDIGGLARALELLVQQQGQLRWTDRIVFLRRREL